jgi:hypothetical protein
MEKKFFMTAIPILDIYPKELKVGFQKDICTRMFIASYLQWSRPGSTPKHP